jgi:hypothetical protein
MHSTIAKDRSQVHWLCCTAAVISNSIVTEGFCNPCFLAYILHPLAGCAE